jgi:SAM-dependent methyltransferase
MNTTAKARYLAWAARGWLVADRTCPGCASSRTRLLKRKHVVTALFGCDACGLMFRMPKSAHVEDSRFYEREYRQAGTTDLPNADELEELKRTSFARIGRDYTGYVDVLRAVGIQPGDSVYDYGASWGYGSWQFMQAGYDVCSYEIGRTRARYAERHLGCRMVAEPSAVPNLVHCFFASHVLEHLDQPQALWRIASEVLRPAGAVVLFMPNGEPDCERRDPRRYHQLWGRVHPLLLTSRSVAAMAASFGFEARAYSSPYDLGQIAAGRPGRLHGDELLVVAHPTSVVHEVGHG